MLPVGTVVSFAGAQAPTGWLPCDGATYPIAVYPDLFQVIKTAYGGGKGTFGVPDCRARLLIVGSTAGGAAVLPSSLGRPEGLAEVQSTNHCVTSNGDSLAPQSEESPHTSAPPCIAFNMIIYAGDAKRTPVAFDTAPKKPASMPCRSRCGICFQNPPELKLNPCGHSVCSTCHASMVNRCPFCQSFVALTTSYWGDSHGGSKGTQGFF